MVLFRRILWSPPMARKSYDEQFKRDAVKLMTDQSYTLAKASAALGVSQATLSTGKKTVLPREQADLMSENVRLLKRVKELEMERDILMLPSGGAATYFAKQCK